MAKINKPLFSLNAIGALGKHLVFRKQGRGTVAQQRPLPSDARTPAQLQWRTMYQKAVALWHLLSPAEKKAWERQATPLHMIGFAYFISQALRPNPGIYLPLSGGAMSGNIDMATNKILNLPAPIADEEPTRKVDLATHEALESAIHGLKGEVGFSVYQTSQQVIPTGVNTMLEWDAEEWDTEGYFDLANNRYKPLLPGKYLFTLAARMRDLADGNELDILLFKNGVYTKMLAYVTIGKAGMPLIVGSAVLLMNGSTDYVHAYIYHLFGANRNTHGAQQTCYFQGYLLPQT